MKKELLRVRSLCCRENDQLLLDHLSFSLYEGEALGILGLQAGWVEALSQTLVGMRASDRDSIAYCGRRITLRSFEEARRYGIYCIRKKTSLLANQTVASNVLGLPTQYGRPIRRLSRELTVTPRFSSRNIYLREQKLNAVVNEYLRMWGIPVQAEQLAGELTERERMLVELARALIGGARMIIMSNTGDFESRDESFWPQTIRWLLTQGVSLLFLDDQPSTLLEVTDRLMLLKNSRPAGVFYRGEVDRATVVSFLTAENGERTDSPIPVSPAEPEDVFTLSCPWSGEGGRLEFTIRRGEIVGVIEASDVLRGRCRSRGLGGGIVTDCASGKRSPIRSVRDALELGIYMIDGAMPYFGLFPNLTVDENLSFMQLEKMTRFPQMVDRGLVRFLYLEMVDQLGMLPENQKDYPRQLTGMQQLRLCLYRGLLLRPRLLILFTPDLHLDFRGRAELGYLLEEIAAFGIAILIFCTNEMPIKSICDRLFFAQAEEKTGSKDDA